MGQWLRAERKAPVLRGTVSHIHADLAICALPPLIRYSDDCFDRLGKSSIRASSPGTYAALARNELHIRRAPTRLRCGKCSSFDEK